MADLIADVATTSTSPPQVDDGPYLYQCLSLSWVVKEACINFGQPVFSNQFRDGVHHSHRLRPFRARSAYAIQYATFFLVRTVMQVTTGRDIWLRNFSVRLSKYLWRAVSHSPWSNKSVAATRRRPRERPGQPDGREVVGRGGVCTVRL